MRAFGFNTHFDETIRSYVSEYDQPEPNVGPSDLLVQVQAVATNPVDTKVRQFGDIPSDAPRVLGYDAVGVVIETGSAVKGFKMRETVFYAGELGRPGSFSDLQAVNAQLVGYAPKTISPVDAASLPLTSITAWELLFLRLGLAKSLDTKGTLLIIGGAGGVGSILIQIARQLTGMTVIATASRPETVDWCTQMGAHYTVDHHKPLGPQLNELGFGEVDVVASLTHTETHLNSIIDVLRPGGKLAVIDDPKNLNALSLKSKSISLHWELMFTRSLFQTKDMGEQGEILDEIADLIDQKILRPTATTRYDRLDAQTLNQALELQATGRSIGKIVLENAQ